MAGSRKVSMNEGMLGELMAVIDMAREIKELAITCQVELDDRLHGTARDPE